MVRLHIRKCFHYLTIATGATILLFWVQLNSISHSGVLNAASEIGLMVGEEHQGTNSYRSSVRNVARETGLMVEEENQGINSYRSSVKNAGAVNGLVVGEENQRFTRSRVRNTTRANEIIVLDDYQRLNSNHAGAETAGIDNNNHFVKYNNFTKMKYGPMYIFGVTVGNSTSSAHWDIIKIRASMGLIYAKERHFICCLKYIDKRYYIRQLVTAFNKRHKHEPLSASHFTCKNPRPGVVPDGVALSLNNQACSDEHVTYRKPEAPPREPGVKLAICTKLAYGTRNAEMLIEFMEVYKYLGVDKFVTYFLEDLNKDARKVLEYYASTGILDLYYFKPAAEETIKRHFHPPDDQSRSDKQLMIFDAFERMSGYTYFGIIDHDEFLIPSNNRSLKNLLADLFFEKNNAAGFIISSKHYCLNKGRHGTTNDQILGQFITTSTKDPEYYAPKNIYRPMYMRPGYIHTHRPEPADKAVHKLVKVPAKEGYIRHFRDCQPFNGVHFPLISQLINDTWVGEWSNRIQRSVENVRYHVFGSSKYVNYET